MDDNKKSDLAAKPDGPKGISNSVTSKSIGRNNNTNSVKSQGSQNTQATTEQQKGRLIDGPTQEELQEYELYKQKLLTKQAKATTQAAANGIILEDDPSSSSSSDEGDLLGRGNNSMIDDDPNDLVGEDDPLLDEEDEEEDNNNNKEDLMTESTITPLTSKGLQPPESIGSNVGAKLKSQLNSGGINKGSSIPSKPLQNDEIYLNNGNVDLKLSKPKIQQNQDLESTKVDPESDRETKKVTKKKKKFKLPPCEEGEDTAGKKKRRKNKKRLMMNVAQTKYMVVRYVGKKVYHMKLTRSDDEDWDVCWQDGAVSCDQLQKMRPYQRINHFPGMYALARKNHLARNLMRMQRIFPDDYKFFPQTWLLPSEYPDYRSQFGKKKNNKTFIVKPEASCQGRGIFLTRNLDDVNPYDHYVIQRYLHKPFLIEGLKFDLRIYVFLCGLDPLRIYMYKEGLSRFATEQYVPPASNNLDNLFMHLTNYAINKNSSKFVQNKSEDDDSLGHKRSLTFIWRYLAAMGHNVESVQKDIKSVIIKTICAVQPQLAHIYKSCQPDDIENSMCFEVLGFDIMFDAHLKPWILEVNHSPSFTTDSPLDFKIKKNLISDTIRLLNLSLSKKLKYKKQKQIEFQKRSMKGKPRATQEEKEKMREKKSKKRDLYEKKNQGEYELIFPSPNDPLENYQKFIQASKTTWEEFNSGTKMKKLLEQQLQIQMQATAQSKDLASILQQKETIEIPKTTAAILQAKQISSKSMRSQSITLKDGIQMLKSDMSIQGGRTGGEVSIATAGTTSLFDLISTKDDGSGINKESLLKSGPPLIEGSTIQIEIPCALTTSGKKQPGTPSEKQPHSLSSSNIMASQTPLNSEPTGRIKNSSSIARPPSGRVRIQLDPNYIELHSGLNPVSHNAKQQYVSSSQIISRGQKRYSEVGGQSFKQGSPSAAGNFKQDFNHSAKPSTAMHIVALSKNNLSSQSSIIVNGNAQTSLNGSSQSQTTVGQKTGVGMLTRFSRLVDKSNSLPLGHQSNNASFHLKQDNSRQIISNNGITPQTIIKPFSLHPRDVASLQADVIMIQNDGKVKPLSTFDHFVKNTAQTLMRSKDTPTNHQGNISGAGHPANGIQYKGSSASTFSYEVDMNIQSINQQQSLMANNMQLNNQQNIKVASFISNSHSTPITAVGSSMNVASALTSSFQNNNHNNQNGAPYSIIAQEKHNRYQHQQSAPSYQTTGLTQVQVLQQSNIQQAQPAIMMVTRDPFKPPTTASANQKLPHSAMERKRTQSTNHRIASAKVQHIQQYPSGISSGQIHGGSMINGILYGGRTIQASHQQMNVNLTTQMRTNVGLNQQGRTLASHLLSANSANPPDFFKSQSVKQGPGILSGNKIPHQGFMVYHMQQKI